MNFILVNTENGRQAYINIASIIAYRETELENWNILVKHTKAAIESHWFFWTKEVTVNYSGPTLSMGTIIITKIENVYVTDSVQEITTKIAAAKARG